MHLEARHLAAALLLSPAAASAQTVSIPTRAHAEPDYYVWITQLSTGPLEWNAVSEGDVAGAYYRAVVTTAEVYNDLFIEYMTLGEEGCCKRVAAVRRVDVEAFADTFGIGGEFNGLAIGEWRSHDTVVLTYRERMFLARLGPEGTLEVEAL